MENSERDGNTKPPDLLLRNLYAGQEATVRTVHGTTDWFQIGKGFGFDIKATYCHPAYFSTYHHSKKNFKIHVCYESYNTVEEVPKSFP